MAKKFDATPYEIGLLIDGDLGFSDVRKDWYRQRYIVRADGLLHDPIHIEFPTMLARDAFDSSIIPGSITAIEDENTIASLEECLGIEPNTDFMFFVMTGRFYRAHDDEPTRFTLIEPKRARDVMLMISWETKTPPPANLAEDNICDSPVRICASFDNNGYDLSTATWIIPAWSPLGHRLCAEAHEHYSERLQGGIEHFKEYAKHRLKIRDELWTRLNSMTSGDDGKTSVAELTFHDYYMHAEWTDASGEECADYFFYTEIGTSAILDLVRTWMTNDTFTLVANF